MLLNGGGWVVQSLFGALGYVCLPGSPTVLAAQFASCVDADSILATGSKSRPERSASSTTQPQPWRPRSPLPSHLVFFHSDKPGL